MSPRTPDPWERAQHGGSEPEASLTVGGDTLQIRLRGGPLLSVESLRWRDAELLLAPAVLPERYRVHGRRAGITLLHPWANRLGADAYVTLGREAHLSEGDGAHRLTRDGNGLAIHGLQAEPGWQIGPGTGDRDGALHAWLDFPGDPAFPFPHRVEVEMTLAAPDGDLAGLTVATTLRAHAATPVPVSVGWHPYFRRSPQSWLELPARRMLAADARGLPTGADAPAPAARISLEDPHLDDGMAGLGDGTQMSLVNPDERITVELLEGYRWGQVFAPPDAPVVSLEPMCAPTDALRHDACPVVAAGASYTASFRVLVAPVSSR